MIYDLDNLGMDRKYLSSFFGIADNTMYKIILDVKKEYGSLSYSLEETAAVMTRYLLASLARNMHKMTEEQKLRFLPDLLKVKDEIKNDDSLGINLYTPRKKPTPKENIIVDPEEDD